MKYKPELGFFGNLERAYTELTKTNNKIFNTESKVASNEEVTNISFVALAENRIINDDVISAHANVFPIWEENVAYSPGQIRVDPLNGQLYRYNDIMSLSLDDEQPTNGGNNPSLMPSKWVAIQQENFEGGIE